MPTTSHIFFLLLISRYYAETYYFECRSKSPQDCAGAVTYVSFILSVICFSSLAYIYKTDNVFKINWKIKTILLVTLVCEQDLFTLLLLTLNSIIEEITIRRIYSYSERLTRFFIDVVFVALLYFLQYIQLQYLHIKE